VLAAAGLVVVVLGFGLAAVVAHQRADNKRPAELLSDQQVSGGEVRAIGPLNGTDLGQYLTDRQAALQKATGQRVAVVSFSRYMSEAEARAAVGTLNVVALLAAPPGGTPSLVSTDMPQWAQQQKAAATSERDQTQEYLKNGVDDPDYKSFYQSELTRLNKLITTIRPDGQLVFGAVVRGAVADLQALASGHKDVRLLDVGASDKVSSRTEYRGIRPEETAKANQTAPRPG
jgi:hypothetical protein